MPKTILPSLMQAILIRYLAEKQKRITNPRLNQLNQYNLVHIQAHMSMLTAVQL